METTTCSECVEELYIECGDNNTCISEFICSVECPVSDECKSADSEEGRLSRFSNLFPFPMSHEDEELDEETEDEWSGNWGDDGWEW